jgi:hypothetical protein
VTRRFLVLLLLAVLLACKKSAAPAEYEYHIFIEGQASLKGAEMAGKPLEGGKHEAVGMSYSVKVPAGEHAADRDFKVVIATSCGTEKIPATLALGIARATGVAAEDKERTETKPGKPVLTELKYEAPKAARVYLDTDRADGTKVEVGATALSVDKAEHDVVVGTCPTAREVKIDGKGAGSINVKTRIVTASSGKKVEVPSTTLVDPTGKHCYEVLTHIYTEKDLDTSNMARSAPKRLERAQVYEQDIDDFMKESPKQMLSKDGWPMRHEVRHCTTKGAKK